MYGHIRKNKSSFYRKVTVPTNLKNPNQTPHQRNLLKLNTQLSSDREKYSHLTQGLEYQRKDSNWSFPQEQEGNSGFHKNILFHIFINGEITSEQFAADTM